jgi:hypothetical protein
MKPPRSIFKSRRKRPPIYIDLVSSVVEKAGRDKPGMTNQVNVWHRHDCPRPRGGTCICQSHEIEVEVVDPERN